MQTTVRWWLSKIPSTRKPYQTDLSDAQWICLERHLPVPKATGRPKEMFRTWRLDGTWQKLNTAIRQCLRVRLGRNPQPSASIVDSQSVKSTGVGGEERSYDWGKQIKGR